MNEITLETKIFDLLDMKKNMKDILLEISSKFKKLNKPIVGQTLNEEGATVKEMAIVIGMKPEKLLNTLRETAGQEIIEITDEQSNSVSKIEPEWVAKEAKHIIDASVLLKKDLSPLKETQKALKDLEKGEMILLKSKFQPEPLIDDFMKHGHDVYVTQVADEEFMTYIKKHINTAKDFKEAGLSPYLDGTQSPRRYFLIATQLPFFIESCIKHSKKIGIDKETLSEIRGLMANTKPQVVDNATIVKRMELEVISKMVDEKCSADEVDDLLIKIADQQLYMQRIHAKCINDVQEVLNDEQYAKLIEILKLGIEND